MHKIQENKPLGEGLTWVLFAGSPSSWGIDARKHMFTFMHTLYETVRVQEYVSFRVHNNMKFFSHTTYTRPPLSVPSHALEFSIVWKIVYYYL